MMCGWDYALQQVFFGSYYRVTMISRVSRPCFSGSVFVCVSGDLCQSACLCVCLACGNVTWQ
jgi:hypothetical protein